MKIQKRNGEFEEVKFDKISKRIKHLAKGLNVDTDTIAQKAIERLSDGILSDAIDSHLASIAMNHNVHPHYNILAGRITVSALHKNTSIDKVMDSDKEKFLKILKNEQLTEEHKIIQKIKKSLYKDEKRETILKKYLEGKSTEKELEYLMILPRIYEVFEILHKQEILSDKLIEDFIANRDEIELHIDYERDFMFDFFGFKTLERAYLLKQYSKKIVQEKIIEDGEEKIIKKTKTISKIVERPQDLFMRVAIGIQGKDIKKVLRLYDLMSKGFYTHATPTLFNAGTVRPQLSSCFLLENEGDSLEAIFRTYAEESQISKNAGGIGVAFHNVRCAGSEIKGTNGISKGIIPFLKIKNEIARAVDQGGSKRKGSIAVYLEPWHGDIREFIQLKKKNGSDETRTRDLFLALWIPNLFWERVKKDEKWSLFDPKTAPNLHQVYGEEFNKLYTKYEEEGRAVDVMSARELLMDIFEVQIETGVPYMLNKDECNIKSNQKNLGTIKSSNLCTEIVEYTDDKTSAVCNLSSICLPKFVKEDGTFDFELLHDVVKDVTVNTDKVIDVNYYINDKTRNSNMQNRPIGMGVQGLADVFFKMKIPYGSLDAKKMNEEIFETIYHAALESSMEMAKEFGAYENYNLNGGCPISHGILQFDMWNQEPASVKYGTNRYDWTKLRGQIKKYGVRNSLLLAPMPTASTSQIFGNTESFEPVTEHIYRRETLAGEFTIANKYLIYHLESLNLWNKEVLAHLVMNNGSIATCEIIPQEVRNIFKTVWEIKLSTQLEMAAERGKYICQSQSFNVHIDKPTMEKMKDIYLYAHKLGLKTMSYYVRTNAERTAQKVTTQDVQTTISKSSEVSKKDDDDCLVCGS